MAQLAQPVSFTPDGHVSPSFDSASAMAEASAKTPLGKCRAAANALPDAKKREKALEDCLKERME